MTDFSITSIATGSRQDTRWRASAHGESSARPGQLDASAFTSGTHYNIPGQDANTIPSGVAVAKLPSGLYGPWAPGEDAPAIAGYINDNEGVVLTGASGQKPTFALLVHGMIKASVLPIAAQRSAVAAAESTGLFTYVED